MPGYKRAQAHPVFATINRLRETYLSLGFDEAENPVIIDEKDIYRQFGPEAMAVLDRVFYLGGLPQPECRYCTEQLDEINEILGAIRVLSPMPNQLRKRGASHASYPPMTPRPRNTPRDAPCLQEIRD